MEFRMPGADFRTVAYVGQRLYLEEKERGRRGRLEEYDILCVDPMRRRYMMEIAEIGGAGQERLVMFGNWLRLLPPERWPGWRKLWHRHFYPEYDIMLEADRLRKAGGPNFFTERSYKNLLEETGTLAAIDNIDYFKLVGRRMLRFLEVWKRLGYTGLMLEWGWFTEPVRWLLGDADDHGLEPVSLRGAMYFFHDVLSTLGAIYGMKIVTQRVTHWSCPSEARRLRFDGLKWEDPYDYVLSYFNRPENRWSSADFAGPGWWKGWSKQFDVSFLEIQRYPQHSDRHWEVRWRQHIHAAKRVGAACCWYNTNKFKSRHPSPDWSDYHTALPRLPEFARAGG